MSLRRRIAAWICPELALEANRLWRMRADMEADRQWIAKEFPDARAFADRALQMDMAYAGEQLPFTAWRWSHDIAQFREELRSGLPQG